MNPSAGPDGPVCPHCGEVALTSLIEKLRGVVEIDEVYIGPKEKGFWQSERGSLLTPHSSTG
jgi:hypothetical protein